MYYDYFGFNQPPFRITPDTSLFYPGGDRGAILDALLYAILNGEGIIKVVGEVGSGKTMLCRMLEKELPDKVEVVYLVNPSIAPENTLHAIAFELKLNVTSDTSRFEVMNALQQYLLQRHAENRQVVVFVEEAQSMPIATLEEIRLLSNLETQQSKLLQIVLFGQPELDEMISRPEIRQLKERITYSFQLAPFKTNDIREYMNTRIRACGYRSTDLFTDAAIREIEQHSHGLLRRINILADKSLLAAFANNSHKVDVRHTRMAARDSEFLARKSVLPKRMRPAAAVATLIVIAWLLWWVPENDPYQTDPASASDPVMEGVPVVPAPAMPAPIVPATPPAEDYPVATPAQVPETGRDTSSDAPDPLVPSTDTPIGAPIQDSESPLGEPPVSMPTGDAASAPEEPIELPAPDTAMDAPGHENVTTDVRVNSEVLEDFGNNSTNFEPEITEEVTQEIPLLDMTEVYKLQDFGDNSLTESEADELKRQLEILPPESIESDEPLHQTSLCRHCWSIIYRPLPLGKNL